MISSILNRCQGGRLCRFLGAASMFATAVCINLRSVPTSSRAGEPEGQLLPRLADVSRPLQPGAQGQGAKYRKLLRTITVEEDRGTYGDYFDYGRWSGTEYNGNKDLPPGYWVYIAPHWYIFGECAGTPAAQPPTAPAPKRAWGPEQACGPPDTHLAGDIQTAWASQTPDGQNEWLRLHYAQAVVPAAIQVYETFNPGALDRVTARKPDGSEVELWSGEDPVKRDAGMGMAYIPVKADSAKADFATDCITIYLKSTKVPGWNEIDAVGLVDQRGQLQWATTAEASSTYADQIPATELTAPMNGPRIDRFERKRAPQLEEQVRKLIDESDKLPPGVHGLRR